MLSVKVRRTLQDRHLFHGASRVLVGCSGGPDSQALLHALASLRAHHGCDLVAASVNHGLRPDAHVDVEAAASLARDLGVPFIPVSVQVPKGASLQANARNARYAALLGLAQRIGAQRIAVGHTLDDQAETVLARLLRGTGVVGVRGILSQRADGVVRPLLDTRRTDVAAYVVTHGLQCVIDPSNASRAYLRVRVRLDHLPYLEAENSALCEHLAALANDADGAAEVIETRVAALLAACGEHVTPLRAESSFLRRAVLQRWVEGAARKKLTRRHMTALEQLVDRAGEVQIPGALTVSVDRQDRLLIAPSTKRGRGQ